MNDREYTYIDGNNNTYLITRCYISYSPVKPEDSSSGNYDGDEARSAVIDDKKFKKLQALIKSLLREKTTQIDIRLMGCGTIIDRNRTVFILSTSPLKAELEEELKKYLRL